LINAEFFKFLVGEPHTPGMIFVLCILLHARPMVALVQPADGGLENEQFLRIEVLACI
jgi:hypothetical protein